MQNKRSAPGFENFIPLSAEDGPELVDDSVLNLLVKAF
jgi:hypothetical protein